jgi:hypothetical protein
VRALRRVDVPQRIAYGIACPHRSR